MTPPPPFWAACPYCAESIELAVTQIAVRVGLGLKVHASAEFAGTHRCQSRQAS